jgi:hypothetical protein
MANSARWPGADYTKIARLASVIAGWPPTAIALVWIARCSVWSRFAHRCSKRIRL